MKPIVYIDGKDGTTGLQIYDRLSARDDIELLLIDEEKRKDLQARKACINQADIVFLCLPDAAAREAVAMVENPATRVIDASTAHRTAPGWVYGFPELKAGQRETIAKAKWVANPGCHATGFISVAYPLIAAGVLPADADLTCFSLTGYSGGGKKMIAQYEASDRGTELSSPCPYGLGQGHKHLPEMQVICGLAKPPVFVPVVDDYYKGMATTVMLHMSQLNGVSSLQQVLEIYQAHYAGQKLVQVVPDTDTAKLYANAKAGSNDLSVVVAGNDGQFTVTALFDNLGKGASGAAVQNMNLMLGLEETTGLL
ncbi:N-acetyl-gamma-glutamyl-phosphate reductase [uncultured Oscillibacter sp.]|uniref:N-acetyl-gamma-glutamyl-phosphate reductase n=1 Tax=uncultured Oscillibacter sp. TaxID=876091 RepID=UPI0025D66E8C|nr:N-acetyl-gamma-glutamyl-phosphate reductase [uncultured Oscillibacter sp.]